MIKFKSRLSDFGVATVEDDERRASQALVWATGLTLILALAWAAFFELDEITRGQGKVIPSSREQVIQSLDSGVLSEMFVREGSVVEKDQVLLRIDDARSGAVFREAAVAADASGVGGRGGLVDCDGVGTEDDVAAGGPAAAEGADCFVGAEGEGRRGVIGQDNGAGVGNG